ncbi:MAG: hypothetical protein HC866_21055, partial [Leptolyngbyaceae cyanobacterium RU_5_1]|nr:hypothetical protein [Leptolyngbyaceae cyanobacterium RU_5_1]
MSYEVAQQILDKLAIAIEIFAAGYVGISFTLYAWKRTASTESQSQPPLAIPMALPQTTEPELVEVSEEAPNRPRRPWSRFHNASTTSLCHTEG